MSYDLEDSPLSKNWNKKSVVKTEWAVRVILNSGNCVYSEICVSESHANDLRRQFGSMSKTQVVRRDVPEWEVVSK